MGAHYPTIFCLAGDPEAVAERGRAGREDTLPEKAAAHDLLPADPGSVRGGGLPVLALLVDCQHGIRRIYFQSLLSLLTFCSAFSISVES